MLEHVLRNKTQLLSLTCICLLIINVYTYSHLKKDVIPSYARETTLHFNQTNSKVVNVLITDQKEMLEKTLDKTFAGLRRRLPQVITIGVGKCGTGALQFFLKLNPNLIVLQHETNYLTFDDRYINGYDGYRKAMPLSYKYQVTIDLGPTYIKTAGVRERMVAMNKDIKLLAIICDPAIRAISHHAHGVATSGGNGTNPLSPLKESLFTENDEVRSSILIYRYDEIFLPWLDFINKGQMFFVDGGKMKTHPLEQLRHVEKFLQVPQTISETQLIFNKTKGFYCKYENTMETCMSSENGRPHDKLDSFYMNKLYNYFQPHSEQFFQMIGKQFDWSPKK